MLKSNKQRSLAITILLLSLVATSVTVFARPSAAGVSPTLGVLLDFSVLGGAEVTNTGDSVLSGRVGVSPGTSLIGFPPGSALATHNNDATAIAAQAEAGVVFGALDQPCEFDLGAGLFDLGGMSLVPGVYCAGSFGLTGTLTLTGGAEEVYIFKSATTLITEVGSQVVGGDPCNVWWRVGSNATLGAGSLMIGNVFSAGESTSAMNAGATLNGRYIGLIPVTITLINNTISIPVCLVPAEPTPTSEPTAGPTAGPTAVPTEGPAAEPTAIPVLHDTGGDLAGPGSQLIRISLGALGLTLVLFGFLLSRRTQKAGR